jgi:hypothetical protein
LKSILQEWGLCQLDSIPICEHSDEPQIL